MYQNKKHSFILIGCTILLFTVCVGIGIRIAHQKPIWVDEAFAYNGAISRPVSDIILLKNIYEGNVTPLYPLTQKIILGLFQFQVPESWHRQEWDADFRARIILRIQPVLFMSLSIAAFFFFFARYYGWITGIYAIAVALSSFMVWTYWAEARVYALWFFLTTMQSLALLKLVTSTSAEKRIWNGLVVIHWFLSFVVVFSVLQIFFASLVLWLWKEKNWKRYVLLSLAPAVIGIGYLLASPAYTFRFVDTPWQLIGASLPKDRLFLLGVYTAVFIFVWYQDRKTRFRIFSSPPIKEGAPFLLFTFCMLLAAVVILASFKMRENLSGGYQISNRYFIYLASIGIAAVSYFSDRLVRSLNERRFLQIMMILLLVGLLWFRFMRVKGFALGYLL